MASRPLDTLDLAPRWSDAEIAALTARVEQLDAPEMLRLLLGERLLGRVALVSSFGADAAVLLDLVAAVDPATPVIFLDTGKHFPETLSYRDTLAARLGLRDLRVVHPDPAALAVRDPAGERWGYDPDGCCDLRKVRPLEHALAGFDASLSGRKAHQAATRAAIAPIERDGDRIKVNPLGRWSAARIAAHFADRDLPRHPLVAAGYLSIGCAPCTSRVAPGEDARAGRWRGTGKIECGIHRPLGEPARLP